MNKIFKLFEDNIKHFYSILFYISLILIIMVIIFIMGAIVDNHEIDNDTVIKLLPALGITLSALLASTSVMKSIQNTNKVEQKREQKELELKKNKISFYLNLVQSFISMYLVDFKTILDDNLLEDFKIKLEEYLKLILNDNELKALNDNEIISYIILLEMNINFTDRYLKKRDYPDNIEDLMEVVEESYNKMDSILDKLKKKYNIE